MTNSHIYRYAIDTVRRGVRMTIRLCRYVLDVASRSVGTTIPAYRFIIGRACRGIRGTIPLYRSVVDCMGPGIQAAISWFSEGVARGIRVSVALYRCALGEMHRGSRETIPLAYRDVVERARRGIQPAISSAYGYFVNGARRTARVAVPVYRSALEEMDRRIRRIIPVLDCAERGVRTAIFSTYRYAINAAHCGVRATVPVYRYVLHETDRGIRVTIPSAYRYVVDKTGRGMRSTISSTYRYAINAARWGVRVTVPVYRYVSERVDRGVRFTIPRICRSVIDTLVWTVHVSAPYAYRSVTIGLITLIVIPPLFLVLYQSFLTAPFFSSTARFGLDAYRLVFADNEFSGAFGTTLILGTGMTLIAVPLGVMLAFLMVRTNVPGRHWLEPLIILPVVVPTVVLAFGYVATLGPVGILTTAFKQWTGAAAPWNLYSFPFLVAIAGLTHVPHVYLCVAVALRGVGSEAEEAARAAGGKVWRVALGVSVPMAMPAILFAASLVFLLGFELFGIPLVLGEPQGLSVLTTYLFKLSHKSAMPPYELMAVVIVVIVAIALQLAFMQQQLLTEAQRHVWVRATGLRSAPFKLRYGRWLALLIVTCWIAVVVLVPLAGLMVRSLVETWDASFVLPQMLMLDHYRALLKRPDVVRAVANTLGIGLFGGACAVTIYGAIALAVHRRPRGWAQALAYLAMVPRAMPGLVAGLVVLWALLFFKPLGALRETLISVWLAYTVVWLAYGVQRVSGTLRSVDPQLEDIARTVGATQARLRFDITLPLIRNGMLASWLLIFLVFVREYATGIYLLVPGTEVIGSLLVSLWEKGATDLVAPLSVVHVVIIGTGLFIANRLGVRLYG